MELVAWAKEVVDAHGVRYDDTWARHLIAIVAGRQKPYDPAIGARQLRHDKKLLDDLAREWAERSAAQDVASR